MSRADVIYNYIESKIKYLREISDTGYGRGLFANLRRGVGRKFGEVPEVWGFVFENIPAELLGNKYKISYAELSIYTALTFYALNQQGNEQNMNVSDVSLGDAAAKLAVKKNNLERIIERLKIVVKAKSFYDLAYHIRGLIQMLSAEGIGMDYRDFAKDLYLINYDENNNTKLSWGRDFQRTYDMLTQKDKDKEDKKKEHK